MKILMETIMDYSYATLRKIRIIKEKLGEGFDFQADGRRIDAIYNDVVGDRRENLFCKIAPDAKAQLDELRQPYAVGMVEFVKKLIMDRYQRYLNDQAVRRLKISQDYTDSE